MTELSRVRLFEMPTAPEPFRVLRAGPLGARSGNGNLRFIRFRAHDVLRAIACV